MPFVPTPITAQQSAVQFVVRIEDMSPVDPNQRRNQNCLKRLGRDDKSQLPRRNTMAVAVRYRRMSVPEAGI